MKVLSRHEAEYFRMYNYAKFVILLSCFIICCNSFNIDVDAPTTFSGVAGEQFGYAVTLHGANNTYW